MLPLFIFYASLFRDPDLKGEHFFCLLASHYIYTRCCFLSVPSSPWCLLDFNFFFFIFFEIEDSDVIHPLIFLISRNAIVTISWYFIERTLPCGLCYFCYNHHYVVIVGCLIGVLRRRNFSFALMQKGCLQLLSDFTFVRQSFQITKHSNMSSKNPSFLQIVKLPPKSTHKSLN